jgi:hypothetical protein
MIKRTTRDLERTIADLVERKERAELVDSAEWRLANNALIALRYSITGAGDIIDGLDRCAETTFHRFAAASPSTEQQPKVLPFRRAGNKKSAKNRSDRAR